MVFTMQIIHGGANMISTAVLQTVRDIRERMKASMKDAARRLFQEGGGGRYLSIR